MTDQEATNILIDALIEISKRDPICQEAGGRSVKTGCICKTWNRICDGCVAREALERFKENRLLISSV